jgi:hypothetical protein
VDPEPDSDPDPKHWVFTLTNLVLRIKFYFQHQRKDDRRPEEEEASERNCLDNSPSADC